MYAKGAATEPDVELAAVRFVCELFARNRHLSEGPVIAEAPESVLDAIRSRGIPQQGRELDDVVAEMEHDVIGYGYKNFQMPYGHPAHLKNVFLIIAHFKGSLQSYHSGDSVNKRSYNAAAQYNGYGADLEFPQYKQRGGKYPEFHYAEIRKACGKDIASEQS